MRGPLPQQRMTQGHRAWPKCPICIRQECDHKQSDVMTLDDEGSWSSIERSDWNSNTDLLSSHNQRRSHVDKKRQLQWKQNVLKDNDIGEWLTHTLVVSWACEFPFLHPPPDSFCPDSQFTDCSSSAYQLWFRCCSYASSLSCDPVFICLLFLSSLTWHPLRLDILVLGWSHALSGLWSSSLTLMFSRVFDPSNSRSNHFTACVYTVSCAMPLPTPYAYGPLEALSDCCSRNHSLDVRSTMLLVSVISHTFALLIRSSGCQIRSDPIHRSVPDPLR
jgi:hypothetical protein